MSAWAYRPCGSGIPYLVFQGNPKPYGTDPGHLPKNTGESSLLCILYRTGQRGDRLQYKQILSEAEYQEEKEKWGSKAFRVGMGAEAIQELLQSIDLEKEYAELQAGLVNATGQKRARIVKRLEVVEAFRESGNKPEWMILSAIPVIPPDLRPMVQLDGGRFCNI